MNQGTTTAVNTQVIDYVPNGLTYFSSSLGSNAAVLNTDGNVVMDFGPIAI